MKLKFLSIIYLSALLCISLTACTTRKDTSDAKETTSPTSEESTTVKAPAITAGSYSATEKGFAGNITVTVTVDDKGKMTDLKIEGPSETPDFGGKAITKLQESILEAQSFNVDAISGATFTSNAVNTALIKALSQAGIDTAAAMSEVESTKGKDEEMSTQVVIVGCGGSGMSAGLAAVENGANVVIVEQSSTYGGTALSDAEGFFAVESPAQLSEGISTTSDNMFNWFMNYTHRTSNAALTRAFLDKSADTVEWVSKYGNPVTLIDNTQLAHQYNIKTYHKFANKQAGFENWYNQLLDKGVRIVFNTKVTQLIKTEDGTITGVIGTKADGGKLKVTADATILATGGYSSNAEMVKEYLGIDYDNLVSTGYTSSGEGILMAMNAGADNYGINTGVFQGATARDGYSFKMPVVCTTPMLWVDKSGKRFVNEDIVYDFTLWGNAAKTAGGSYWIIVDEATLKKFAKKGSPFTNSFIKTQMANLGFSTDDAPVKIDAEPDIIDTFTKVAKEKDWAAKEYTLVDLAKAIGVPAKNLTDTIKQYNDAVASHKDDLFNKPGKYLKYDVSMGPFYAIQASAILEGSAGGISVNENLEVVRPDATPITGLYAAGNNVGGLYGVSSTTQEGVPLGFAINSGRIAGESAAAFAKR